MDESCGLDCLCCQVLSEHLIRLESSESHSSGIEEEECRSVSPAIPASHKSSIGAKAAPTLSVPNCCAEKISSNMMTVKSTTMPAKDCGHGVLKQLLLNEFQQSYPHMFATFSNN